MADIEIEKKHNLDFEQARSQAKKWADEAQKKYGLNVDYKEGEHQDTISVKRAGVDGKAVLDAEKLSFEAKLGFIAKPLKGKIKEGVNDGINKYFS